MPEPLNDADDLLRRARLQAATGNYWAGKYIGLRGKLAEAEAERDAAYAVIRHAIDHWLTRAPFTGSTDAGFPHEWTAGDWAESGWTAAEEAAIRAATGAFPDRRTEGS